MAITQNTFTGNGSNLGPFSFTFKWLEPTDIKVTVAGVLKTAGTHYNLQNLNYTTKNGGQVLFTAGNAPANGAAIVIYRQTDDTDLAATFYSGSAIRAQDLNSNFTQGLYVTQEANNNVVTANATANTALTNSNTAISTANSAVSTANTASSNASAAVATANTASSNASAAVSTANTASSNATAAVNTANSAASTASTALSTANTALSTANTASSNASTALSTANTASTNASAAVSTANTASSNASSAVSTANTASSNASTALSTANTAISTANAAASAVANALLYDIVANVAAIPGSPVNNDAVEITDSTGIESFTPLTGVPGGFVGNSGLSVRIVYTTTGNTWTWIQYFPNDPETRYLKTSGGTLTGQLKADDSTSVAAPVYSFDGDTNTGIAHTGADELALVTNGVERASIRSGQFLVGNAATSRGMLLGTSDSVTSNAGIEIFRSVGTSNPLNAGMFVTVNPANNNGRANLVLAKTNGNANGSFTAVGAGTLGGVVFAGANGTTITPAAQITGSCSQTPNGTSVPGSLGFWTTASGATYPTQRVTIGSDGTFTASDAAIFSSTVAIGSNLTVDTDTLFVDATNNRVGVGTTTVDSLFHVNESANASLDALFVARGGNGLSSEARFLTKNSGGTNTGGAVGFDASAGLCLTASATSIDSAKNVVIDSSGRVGIGTTSPAGTLTVNNSSGNCVLEISRGAAGAGYGYQLTGGDGATTPALRFTPISNGAWGSEAMRLDSSGRLLVGTSAARANFFNQASGFETTAQIEGTTYQTSSLSLTQNVNDGSAPFFVLGKTRSGSVGGNTVVSSGDSLGTISFQGSDGSQLVEGARIRVEVDGTPGANDVPGRLVFSTTADGASSPTERLRITSTGQVRLAGAGITFNGDTATANELDDYEEGTFTPAVTGTTVAGTATYTSQVGSYTKIGRLVQAQLNVTYSGHTGTGNLTLTGLPFTSQNRTNDIATAAVQHANLALTAGNVATAYVNQNATSIRLDQVPTGGGAANAVPMDAAATIGITVVYTV